MMWIWGRPLNVDLYNLLEDIRDEAKLKLHKDTLTTIRNSGNDIFVTCPNLFGHGGVSERTPSCSISKDTGVVHCFGCNYIDSMPGMIAKILELKSIISGYRWLLKKYSTPVVGERPELKLDLNNRIVTKKYISEEALTIFDYDHPYMFKRGLTENVINWFDIGYDKGTNAITIPIRDVNDNILFIKKRPINRSKFHKYHIDEGAEKRDIVFGLNFIRKSIDKVKMIYLCEGEFDAMSFYVIEKYGAGVQGDRLFDSQLKQLLRVARGVPICLFFDNDKAGRQCTRETAEFLKPYFPLYKPVYPKKYKDPNELLVAGLLAEVDIIPY